MSGVFACAVPFAALAALAAFDTDRRDGLLLIGAVWLVNQVYGFAVLGYPMEAQAYLLGARHRARRRCRLLCRPRRRLLLWLHRARC